MKETYYFSHDCNARNDEKILMLRAEHGMEGYGIYWALVEMMFESAETCLYHNKVKGVAVSYNIDITLLQDVINTCITEGLFDSDDDVFWSESLRRRKDKYHEIKQKKSDAGKKGMAKRWGNDNTVITPLLDSNITDITEDNKGKEKETKVNEIKNIYAEYVTMTENEYNKLVEKHGQALTEQMIEVLDNYKGSKGKTYKSDYRAILSWVVDKIVTSKPKDTGRVGIPPCTSVLGEREGPMPC